MPTLPQAVLRGPVEDAEVQGWDTQSLIALEAMKRRTIVATNIFGMNVSYRYPMLCFKFATAQ
jgi:hypothetical protein